MRPRRGGGGPSRGAVQGPTTGRPRIGPPVEEAFEVVAQGRCGGAATGRALWPLLSGQSSRSQRGMAEFNRRGAGFFLGDAVQDFLTIVSGESRTQASGAHTGLLPSE